MDQKMTESGGAPHDTQESLQPPQILVNVGQRVPHSKRVDPHALDHRFSDKASIYSYLKQQLVSTATRHSLTTFFPTAPLPDA